jgi:hypothetical protein
VLQSVIRRAATCPPYPFRGSAALHCFQAHSYAPHVLRGHPDAAHHSWDGVRCCTIPFGDAKSGNHRVADWVADGGATEGNRPLHVRCGESGDGETVQRRARDNIDGR